MQTLLEALETNSLEHKLEMQIRTALDSKEDEDQQGQNENYTEYYQKE